MANNNLNILPFYESTEEQDHNNWYSYGRVYNLISKKDQFLPFQIVRSKDLNGDSYGDITSVKIHPFSNDSNGIIQINPVNVVSEVVQSGLEIKEFEDYDLIVYPSAYGFDNISLSEGMYYLEIKDSDNTWYSDVFTVVHDLSSFIKLRYHDSENIYYKGGHIEYDGTFRNACYLQAEIGKPEYPFEEEAEDRDGYKFVEKQISEKKYKFEFAAPEYLCDALRIVRMHDFIRITFKGKEYDIEDIIIDPKWKKNGNLAIVSVEFECDTVIKKIGKAHGSLENGNLNVFSDKVFSNKVLA